MNLCKTCKWWGKEHGSRGNPHLRSCGNPKHIMDYGSSERVPDDGIIIEIDEGWGMEVGPDFGCVNHEPSQ